ncbi:MAG TPA: arylesterase [Bryobacteraceae bacterium]|nr:arylesterase [Bryobacteraceae bacterium]
MRLFVIIAACFLLLGCRSEPGSERQASRPQEQAPPAQAPKPADTRPVIAAFGDSLTAGFGADPGKSYPDYLQQLLDRAGYAYRVVNLGISGDTTSGGVARIDSVIAVNPEIVILELGANDGLRGLPPSATRANLDEMITALKKAGADVVLAGMTLPRNYGSQYIRDFESVFTDLARKHSVALVPFLLAGVADRRELMQGDGLHPTAEGNRRVAANVMKTLEPLLNKARSSNAVR